MYCSSCGVSVNQGLSYCNYCGAKLNGETGESLVESTEVKPELLVSSMVALFIFGLIAIAVLLGVMKRVAGFDLPILLAFTMFGFALMLVVEGVLIRLLLKGRRGARGVGGAGRLEERKTKEFGDAQARMLPEPVPSVTEHTTRAFEPNYVERKSK